MSDELISTTTQIKTKILKRMKYQDKIWIFLKVCL